MKKLYLSDEELELTDYALTKTENLLFEELEELYHNDFEKFITDWRYDTWCKLNKINKLFEKE